MRHKITILVALLSIAAGTSARASQTQLRAALENGNYAAAGSMVQGSAAGVHRPTLLFMARQNLVPAQWLLAGDYWRAGEVDKAVSWAFTARMGTLLDSASCADRRAEGVDRYVAHTYRAIFVRSASDPAMEQRALRDASSFHQQTIDRTMDPEWTCRYWAAIDPQQRKVRANDSSHDKQVSERKRALQRILRRGRIDLGIPVEGKQESDPIKRSLVPSGIPQSWLGSGSKAGTQ